ncbi:hypothetical protein WJX73_001540 [Symbiochloris irregularis]|uniref:BTB domain-containing protein n=1 Tax=Symbiochloris irregularis TaxID=706552 RepID=A0AAW1PNB6_9CHLO
MGDSKKRKASPEDESKEPCFAHLDTFPPDQRDWLQLTADVNLEANTGVKVPVHASQLVQWSRVLGGCITAVVSPAQLKDYKLRLPVDIPDAVLTDMLRPLYASLAADELGKLVDTRSDRTFEVLRAAHKYDFNRLLESMEKLAVSSVSANCSSSSAAYRAQALEAIQWVAIAQELDLKLLTAKCEEVS